MHHPRDGTHRVHLIPGFEPEVIGRKFQGATCLTVVQLRARCWFCDSPGVSKEHVVPLWFRQAFPQDAVWVHRSQRNPWSPATTKRAKRPSFVSRKFCRECNNGWMAALGDEARRALLPLMRGEARELAPAEQGLIARWATMSVLVWQSLDPEEMRAFSREHYHEFFTTRAPLRGSQVWVGTWERADPSLQRGHTIRVRLADGTYAMTRGATLACGRLVLHLVVVDRAVASLRLRYDVNRALRQIWPIEHQLVAWPPSQALSWSALAQLVELIRDNSSVVASNGTDA